MPSGRVLDSFRTKPSRAELSAPRINLVNSRHPVLGDHDTIRIQHRNTSRIPFGADNQRKAAGVAGY